uniref:Uncharacterized protein n=1 Tax=Rhizophora mucronata TaxID=61149 RepID=A0A2P2Q3Z5_RHIMU
MAFIYHNPQLKVVCQMTLEVSQLLGLPLGPDIFQASQAAAQFV